MNNYIITNGELCHYGVKGMRWGVRRGLKELRESKTSGSKGAHNHAVATLTSHRDKANKKISKLQTKQVKLQKRVDKANTVVAKKQARAEKKSAKYGRKASRRFAPRREKNIRKMMKWEAKANSYNAKALKAKAKLEKNRQMQEMFKKGVNDINKELVTKGQDFLYMKSNGMPYTKADID